MDATQVIALYAAIVSTVAVGWQLVEYRLRRRTKIRVELEHAIGPAGQEEGESYDYLVSVLAINDGGSTEYVQSAGLEAPGGYGVGMNIEQELPPRQRIATSFSEAEFPEGFSQGFQGKVTLASGKVFTSDVERCDSDVREMQPEHADLTSVSADSA